MTHEEHKETLALVALGEEMGPERRDALEVHLAACGECRAELRELSDAAAMLALSSDPAQPSPKLRSRILSEIRTTSQERAASDTSSQTLGPLADVPTHPAQDGSSAGAPTLASGAAASAPDGSPVAIRKNSTFEKAAANVVPLDAGQREARRAGVSKRPVLLFGYLAASLAIAALSFSLAMFYQRNNQLRSEIARLSSQLKEARSQLSDTRTELARARGEAELLSEPDARIAELSGTEVAASARARIVFNEATGEALLVAAKLPPPPAGKAYQLWYIAGGKPLPGPVFTTDPSGRGQLRERIPPEGRRAELFAVTLEPAGGLPAPSGEMYLKGPAS